MGNKRIPIKLVSNVIDYHSKGLTMEELEINRIPLTDEEVACRAFFKLVTMNGLPTGDNIARCIRLFPMLAKEAGFGNGEAK